MIQVNLNDKVRHDVLGFAKQMAEKSEQKIFPKW